MRVGWDLQTVTGPRPTGLGMATRLYLDAVQQHALEVEVVGLLPNEEERPLVGVLDRLRWEQWDLPRALAARHRCAPLDLHFTPSLGAPLRRPVPQVTQVQDLIPLVYPEAFRGGAGLYWKRYLPHTWRSSAALTVSNSVVADDVAERLGYERSRIHVVPFYAAGDKGVRPSVAAEWVDGTERGEAGAARPETAALPGPARFLTIGSHEPRKNIGLAIDALGQLSRGPLDAQLACIGIETPHTDELREHARRVGASVEFPGYLDRAALYNQLVICTTLLFPSRYEGFGLPPLEAMSVGCAVVLSDIPVHRAVYDDPQRWAHCPQDCRERPPFVAVDDVDGLAQVMHRLVEDSAWRSALRRSGLAYSATFTPAATAAALVSAFRSVL